MKRPFKMIEPLTGEIQSDKDIKFGVFKSVNRTQQILAQLVAKSIKEDQINEHH